MITVQGFETVRYLQHIDREARIAGCRLSQLISSIVYVLIVALATPLMSLGAAVILAEAADLDADVIVLGTHGLGGVKSLMLGNVSDAVLHHADRAVLVVPSPSLAEQRHHCAVVFNLG